MTVTSNTDIPDGFKRHFRQSPLTDPWEPLYSKRTDKAVIIGLRLARPHRVTKRRAERLWAFRLGFSNDQSIPKRPPAKSDRR